MESNSRRKAVSTRKDQAERSADEFEYTERFTLLVKCLGTH